MGASQSGSGGGQWKGELCVETSKRPAYRTQDGTASTHNPKIKLDGTHIFSNSNKDQLKDEDGFNEDIEQVWTYKVSLTRYQLTNFLFYHMFIVFKTKNWYWSVEKHADKVTIQRNESMSEVRDYYRGERRIGTPQEINWAFGSKKAKHIIDQVNLFDSYDPITSNCQQFASRLYNAIAR